MKTTNKIEVASFVEAIKTLNTRKFRNEQMSIKRLGEDKISFWVPEKTPTNEDMEIGTFETNVSAKAVSLSDWSFKTMVSPLTFQTELESVLFNCTGFILGSIQRFIDTNLDKYYQIGIGYDPEIEYTYDDETQELLVTARVGIIGILETVNF